MTKCECGTRTGKPCRKNAVKGGTKCAVHMHKTCYAVTSKRRSSGTRKTTPHTKCACETKAGLRCQKMAVIGEGFCRTHLNKCKKMSPEVWKTDFFGWDDAAWAKSEALRRSYETQSQPWPPVTEQPRVYRRVGGF